MRSRVIDSRAMVAAFLFLAFALRLGGLTSESLWIDEGYSIALADHSIPDVVRGTIADQHPPLYYLLLHFWQKLGHSDYHVRYLSVLIGLLGVAACYPLAQTLFGKSVALGTLIAVAISPMHVWYSQEARMYILLSLLATLSVYFFVCILNGKRTWLQYCLLTLMCLYTHNYAVFILLAQNALILVALAKKLVSVRLFGRWIVGQASIAVLYAVWIPIVLYQSRQHQMTWLASPTIPVLRGTLDWLLLGASGAQPTGIVWLVMVVLLGVVAVSQRHRLDQVAVVLVWGFLPLSVSYLVSQFYPVFQSKQFLIVLPALAMLTALGVRGLAPVPRLALASMLLAYNVAGLSSMYDSQTKHDWRGVAARISEQYGDGDTIYLNPAAGMLTLNRYLTQQASYAGYPPDYSILRGGWDGERVTLDAPDRLLRPLAQEYHRLWLVEFGPSFWDPDALIPEWLVSRGREVDDWTMTGIRVRLYEF